MSKASEAILSLQPVTFRYKEEIDSSATPQFGLVAEEVAKVDPDLVARDEEGKPYTVRYEAVNAMLLNEFLKEHKKVEEQAEKVGRASQRNHPTKGCTERGNGSNRRQRALGWKRTPSPAKPVGEVRPVKRT